jgi:8-oxo-dGTP pyrophosphatase MutT (NUDIX family)
MLFLYMLLKIYFGNKPLIIANEKTEEINPYLDDTNSKVLQTNEQAQIQSLIREMSDEKLTAAIILGDVMETMKTIRNEFTVIQASGGMVYSFDKKVLLIFRRGKWDLPKGKLDDGEDLVECALREVREETGLDFLNYLDFISISYHTYYENDNHILKESHWYLLEGNEKELLIPQTDEDIENCEWVAIKDLPPYLENAPSSVIDVVEAGLKLIKKNLPPK